MKYYTSIWHDSLIMNHASFWRSTFPFVSTHIFMGFYLQIWSSPVWLSKSTVFLEIRMTPVHLNLSFHLGFPKYYLQWFIKFICKVLLVPWDEINLRQIWNKWQQFDAYLFLHAMYLPQFLSHNCCLFPSNVQCLREREAN